MAVSIHPSAISQFNQRAVSLIDRLKKSETRHEEIKQERFQPDFHIKVHTLDANDILGEVETKLVDFRGTTLSRSFSHGGMTFTLDGSDFIEFVMLAEKINRQRELYEKTSKDFIEEQLFNWIRDAYRKQTDRDACSYIIQKCESAIQSIEIWVPIATMSIETEIQIGHVLFKQMTKSILDQWEKAVFGKRIEQDENYREHFDKYRRLFQGYAAGVFTTQAEPKRAQEMAILQVERSLSLLRLFVPANFNPSFQCFVDIRGREHIEKEYIVTISANSKTSLITGISNIVNNWTLRTDDIAFMLQHGLSELSRILSSEKPTEFEDKIIEAAMIYSRVPLRSDISDKLVYLFAALESILIKNSSEPIQQNLADRLALISGKSTEEKRHIVNLTKKVYEMRSAFVHHAQSTSDVHLLEEFMPIVLTAFTHFALIAKKFKMHSDFIDAIDNLKYS